MDPAEVRRRNFLAPERFPLTTLSGTPYDSGDYAGALERVLAAAGYESLRAEQAARRAAGDRRLLGIGLASYVERTAGIFRPDYGSVELLADGTLRAVTGSSPYGQGHHTAWAMLVSDRTGVPMERIEVVHGDTDVVPRGGITGGSRSVQSNGVAMWRAAGTAGGGGPAPGRRAAGGQRRRRRARHRSRRLPRGRYPGVGSTGRAGGGTGRGRRVGPWRGWGRALGRGAGRLERSADPARRARLRGRRSHVPLRRARGGGRGRRRDRSRCSCCRLVAVDDAGVILNPLLADGQVHGGLAQGAAQALWEGVVYDADGNPLTANFADYGIVSAAELPSFERVPMETPTPLNELGAKGIGESGTVGATPAVHNAVIDALVPPRHPPPRHAPHPRARLARPAGSRPRGLTSIVGGAQRSGTGPRGSGAVRRTERRVSDDLRKVPRNPAGRTTTSTRHDVGGWRAGLRLTRRAPGTSPPWSREPGRPIGRAGWFEGSWAHALGCAPVRSSVSTSERVPTTPEWTADAQRRRCRRLCAGPASVQLNGRRVGVVAGESVEHVYRSDQGRGYTHAANQSSMPSSSSYCFSKRSRGSLVGLPWSYHQRRPRSGRTQSSE